MNRAKQGAKLEVFVEKLFKDMGKVRVRRNVQYSIRGVVSKKRMRAQIDVEYWDLLGKTIVECKYYVWDVPKNDVETFHERAKKVIHSKAVMITNSNYTNDAKKFARRKGIKLIDGEELKKMDHDRLSIPGMVLDRLGKRKSLDDQIRDVNMRKYKKYHSSRTYTI